MEEEMLVVEDNKLQWEGLEGETIAGTDLRGSK